MSKPASSSVRPAENAPQPARATFRIYIATPEAEPGIGSSQPIGAADIAALLAPVLWFSADEPFIVQGDLGQPDPHPCDDPSPGGVVYYQVHRIGLRGPERLTFPEHADPQFIEKVERVTLRCFLYYRYDFGVRGREHDLEVADMQVVLETSDEGCIQVRLTRVIGFAHGVLRAATTVGACPPGPPALESLHRMMRGHLW